MTSKKPYYPNNWKKYKDAPDDVFKALSWEEFYDWRVCNWEFLDSITCVIRVENKKTGKVHEHSYQRFKSAQKKLAQLMADPDNVITVADCDEIHLIKHFDDDELLGLDSDD